MIKRILKYITVAFIVLFYGCSTEKNTFTSRTFHNLTSHYNVYFNGKEALKQGERKINTGFEDDYSRVLSIFKYGSIEVSSNSFSDMDHAIQKASKVIKLHSITVKPKKKKSKSKMTDRQKKFYKKSEYCNWVDNSFFLMGQAYFYRQEYFNAVERFQYVMAMYPDADVYCDAMLWMGRSYIEDKRFDEAILVLDQIDAEKEFPKRLFREYYLLYADYYMKQNKYDDAVPMLKKAIEKTRKKRNKARYKYILAQIYQENNDNRKAANLYAEVVKLNPDYVMAFNAKINRASLAEAKGGNLKELKKELNKMLNDDKNIDYKDQIYFALANISYKEKKIDEALNFYKQSAQASISNDNQKAISYLSVADIYYEKPNYLDAKLYYDSTMMFLSTDHTDYSEMSKKSKSLTDLAENLIVINYQDSVQHLASLSVKERNKIIDEIIEKVIEEEERIKEQMLLDQQNKLIYNQNQQQNRNGSKSSGGKWYFYNQATLSSGMSDFTRKWGQRKLEDNWRRKNKTVITFEEETDELAEDGDSTDVKEKKGSNKSRDYYLKDIPLTDSLILASNQKIEEALYNLGRIYKEQFVNYNESVNTFENLVKRYPETEYKLSSYYNMYKVYGILDNTPKETYYKNLIITDHPESNYAKMLTNPNYFEEQEAKRQAIRNKYAETYSEYLLNNYSKVVSNSDDIIKKNPDHELVPKFKYLRAISVGKLSNINVLKTELEKFVAENPDAPEKRSAEDILAYLDTDKMKLLIEELQKNGTYESYKAEPIVEKVVVEEIVEEELYKESSDAKHFYIIVIDNEEVDINRLKFNISSYNIDNFSMFDFNVRSVLLNSDNRMVTVKILDNKDQAMRYFAAINANTEVYSNIQGKYKHFVISAINFPIFFNDKDVDKYLKFFNNSYLSE